MPSASSSGDFDLCRRETRGESEGGVKSEGGKGCLLRSGEKSRLAKTRGRAHRLTPRGMKASIVGLHKGEAIHNDGFPKRNSDSRTDRNQSKRGKKTWLSGGRRGKIRLNKTRRWKCASLMVG